MRFETSINRYGDLSPIDEQTYVEIPVIKIKVPELIEPMEQKNAKPSSEFKEVPDETPMESLKKDFKTSEDFEPPVVPGEVNVENAPPLEDDVDFMRIEQVPIYPGCENKTTNDERRKCMSEKITKLVQRKFDTQLASELGLTGKQVIHTQLKLITKDVLLM